MDVAKLKDSQVERLEIYDKVLKKIDNRFILKGGTALLLYYGLDRFSEDIDLDSVVDNMNISNQINNGNKEWKINIRKDIDTVFRVMIDYGAKNEKEDYPLKLEISSRNKNLLKQKKLEYVNIEGVNVYKLEEILKMKVIAFSDRDKIRDFYDLAFYLEKNPEKFSDDMLDTFKIKMDYKDLDDLACLLEEEFEENSLKKIDGEEIVLNTYNKLESLIQDRDFEKKNLFISNFIDKINLEKKEEIYTDVIIDAIDYQNILVDFKKNKKDTIILFENISNYFFKNFEINSVYEYITDERNNLTKNYIEYFQEKFEKEIKKTEKIREKKEEKVISKKDDFEMGI